MPEFPVRIATADIHVETAASQPRTVFVHGLSGDLTLWTPLWSALRGLDPLRYDLRGHGRSVGQESASYNHATDLLQLLDALGLAEIDLVGVSMGGSIALNFALEYPARVRQLVLISPGIVGWEWSGTWRALWQPIVDHARAGDVDSARELWWQHPLFATTRATPAASALHDSILRFSGRQWIHDQHVPMLPDLERVHTLRMPTLLVSGGLDLDDFRLIADLIEASAAERVVRVAFPACGHLIPLEDPEGCASVLTERLLAARDA